MRDELAHKRQLDLAQVTKVPTAPQPIPGKHNVCIMICNCCVTLVLLKCVGSHIWWGNEEHRDSSGWWKCYWSNHKIPWNWRHPCFWSQDEKSYLIQFWALSFTHQSYIWSYEINHICNFNLVTLMRETQCSKPNQNNMIFRPVDNGSYLFKAGVTERNAPHVVFQSNVCDYVEINPFHYIKRKRWGIDCGEITDWDVMEEIMHIICHSWHTAKYNTFFMQIIWDRGFKELNAVPEEHLFYWQIQCWILLDKEKGWSRLCLRSISYISALKNSIYLSLLSYMDVVPVLWLNVVMAYHVLMLLIWIMIYLLAAVCMLQALTVQNILPYFLSDFPNKGHYSKCQEEFMLCCIWLRPWDADC